MASDLQRHVRLTRARQSLLELVVPSKFYRVHRSMLLISHAHHVTLQLICTAFLRLRVCCFLRAHVRGCRREGGMGRTLSTSCIFSASRTVIFLCVSCPCRMFRSCIVTSTSSSLVHSCPCTSNYHSQHSTLSTPLLQTS